MLRATRAFEQPETKPARIDSDAWIVQSCPGAVGALVFVALMVRR
jgi:hypothetical protein